MKRNLLNFVLSLVLITNVAWAQERIVSGKVTSAEDGSPIPGVNVILKGTTSGNTTDVTGSFKLSVPSSGGVLVFSFIGLKTQEVQIGERAIIDVPMSADVTQLAELVVTAQGVEKDQRSIGYAMKTVKGDLVAQKSEVNFLNTLQGKLSGVIITGASGGAGSSTNINIRGVTSFSGSNQPLIVVDGIIFNNDVNSNPSLFGGGGQNTLFGTQPSNRLSDISPENIESVNVLKGPGAAVLYGSRASNGVIVITTKKGSKVAGKTEVTITSSINFQDVYGIPKFQEQYGQGVNNDYNPTSTNSWGPAFGGALTQVLNDQQTELVPYQAYPNNYKGFFDQGRTIQNGVNIASGDKEKNFSLSLSSSDQKGIIPTTEYSRYSVQVGGNTKLDNGLRLSSSVTYVRSGQNGAFQGNGGSATGQLTRVPVSYNLNHGTNTNPTTGGSVYFLPGQNHPLWSVRNEQVNTTIDRIFGNMTIGYDIKPWLNVSYRATSDVYTDRTKSYNAVGSARFPSGRVDEAVTYSSELNGDLMIRASKDDILPGLTASVLLGNNLNQRVTQGTYADAVALTVPHFRSLGVGGVFTNTSNFGTKRRLSGVYGNLNLAYKDYLFVELQGRVDKSSTLPKENNTFFYPGINASFIVSEALKIESSILSSLKVRGSAAKVGKDANPYLLNPVYVIGSYGNNVASITFPMSIGSSSVPGFGPSARLANPVPLTPEFTTSYEGGVNVGLFKNKLTLDVGYFYSESSNQIFNVSISNSSGYDTQTSNVGLITNKGWEVELSANPVRVGNFNWDIAFNFSALRNKVERIAPGITSSTIGGNSFIGISPSIKEGYPYGVVVGTDYATNEHGQRLINPATGAYQPGVPNNVVSNPQNKWISGLTNTLTYKQFALSALVDVKYGAQLYSFTWTDLRQVGMLEITGKDRDKPRVLPGVIANGDGTYTDNYIQIASQTYWNGLGGLASKAAVFDATTYRLRELSFSYQLPASLLSKTPFGGVSIGLSGRNLWFYAPNAPGDPELNTQGAGNIQGMDLNGAPNTRNYGFNLRVSL
jgi:TonB-linked SusC/RagA family outer membrane protein